MPVLRFDDHVFGQTRQEHFQIRTLGYVPIDELLIASLTTYASHASEAREGRYEA